MTNFQEDFYTENVDYLRGSPHLRRPLYERLVTTIRQQLMSLAQAGLPLTVLEFGAGHGGFTEPALAFGCEVTAVEMSQASIVELQQRFGQNSSFSASYDPDGDLVGFSGSYSLVLYVSVLHHIPDYMASLDRATKYLLPGGSLISLQDPLWYDRVPRRALGLNFLGYALWRVRQGDIGRALTTRVRRMRGVFDESNPADMVEYHVVRNGVDEEAILELCQSRFDDAHLHRYWSNQSPQIQWLGDRLHLTNTFGVVATGYRPVIHHRTGNDGVAG
jgi:SAM-dependent methyltransferase